MIRRPPRSTLDRSSAASDVYKRQGTYASASDRTMFTDAPHPDVRLVVITGGTGASTSFAIAEAVSYTHLRAHETVLDLVCRLLLEKKTATKLFDLLHHSRTISNITYCDAQPCSTTAPH